MRQIIVLILLAAVACQSKTDQENSTQLGVLNHQFSISEPAQEAFERGLLLLHSFEYDDAREAFREAVNSDESELMAHWGLAMTHYKALWGLQNIDSGRVVIATVGSSQEERLSKAENELEADFWNAIEILYGEGTLKERNSAYADHMGELYEKYINNQEVAAFYALGLMWAVDEGRDSVMFDKSASIAASVLEENPNHPGALHYLIHANDDPNYAQLSKEAADKYAKVAPDATHALHMPSHIYLALGMWNDVVASNEQSYAASVARMERKGLDDKARGYHSYRWLHYGYLQQGRFDKAEELLKDMLVYTKRTPNRSANRYLIEMQNSQKIESGKWIEGVEPMSVDDSKLSLTSKASQHFFKAMNAFKDEDQEAVTKEIEDLNIKIMSAETSVSEEAIAVCSSGSSRYAPSRVSIIRANVILTQMEAMITMLKNEDVLTDKFLSAATNLEDEAGYSNGPPNIPYPSYEQYGDWLLEKGKPAEALVQYNRCLKISSNRSRSLQGKINALTALNRIDEANEVRAVINQFWKQELVAEN